MLDPINQEPDAFSSPTDQPHSLLDLPPEITVKIWRYALVIPDAIKIHCHPDTESVLFEGGKHDPDAQIRLRDQQLNIPVSLLPTCRRVYDEAISLLYEENLFEFDALYSRFPPLTQSSFVILPRSRMFALERISIGTPWFDAMTLNGYTNLHTIIFRLSGQIFLARADLPGRDHPRTIRRPPTTRPKADRPVYTMPDEPNGELDDDGPDQYYETLREVDDDAVIAYAQRDYEYSSAYYNNMALMCRGISPSVEVFFSFLLQHLDPASVSRLDEAVGRQVLIPARKILKFTDLDAEDRAAIREEMAEHRNLWGGLSTLVVP
ncbi:hypothetical protein LTR84_003358 [Exophiala bonariae]|uniref:DUF7730 domain-containing protein n=1 Tax=Exophiala bonariae TaxID=1690606 RepID=A0AAV9NAR9_9EURO|nr:hypothetical protein LTR84_003358 [Exophiala bonariae]